MRKLRKSIIAAITIGLITVSMSITAVAASNNLDHWSYYDGWMGYKAGLSGTSTIYYPQKHRSWARVGFTNDIKIGYRYTQTDVVSGFGSFSHGCKVEYW